MTSRHHAPLRDNQNSQTHFYGPIHKMIRPRPKQKFTDLTNTALDSIVELPEETRNNTTASNVGKSYFACEPENIDEYEEGAEKIQVNRSTMNKHQTFSSPNVVKLPSKFNRAVRSPTAFEARLRSPTVYDNKEEAKEQTLIKIKKTIFSETYKERNCILKEGIFRYYSGKILKGVIDFTMINAKIEYSLKRPSFRIRAENSLKNFDFLIPSNNANQDLYAVRDQWIRLLHSHMQKHKSSLRKRPRLPLTIPRFWRHDRISESKFVYIADTGDVLLFRTHNIGGKVQRFVTRSKYDHTAMILKYSDSRVMILEATSNEVRNVIRGRVYLLLERFCEIRRA